MTPTTSNHIVTETWIIPKRGQAPVQIDLMVVTHAELGGYRINKDTGSAARMGIHHINTFRDMGNTVTLIERDAARTAGLLADGLHRRNVVVDADDLQGYVGQTFAIGGSVVLRALEACEPCSRLAKLTGRTMPDLKALVHTGLRCEVVHVGAIGPGDKLRLSS